MMLRWMSRHHLSSVSVQVNGPLADLRDRLLGRLGEEILCVLEKRGRMRIVALEAPVRFPEHETGESLDVGGPVGVAVPISSFPAKGYGPQQWLVAGYVVGFPGFLRSLLWPVLDLLFALLALPRP